MGIPNGAAKKVPQEKKDTMYINPSARYSEQNRYVSNDRHKSVQHKHHQAKKKSSIQQEKLMLSQTELSELYSQCINLATANKINQENTWNLPLIDYIGDVLESDKNGV